MQQFLSYYLDYLTQKEELASYPVSFPSLQELKNEYMSFLLQITSHDIKETSEILNISKGTLFRNMTGR